MYPSDVDGDSMHNVDEALQIIDRTRGSMAIETLAKRVGITRRHLERQFKEHVGLGAKHLARIARIHCALDLLQQQPSLSGAAIAAACGYSDQAHAEDQLRPRSLCVGRCKRRRKTPRRDGVEADCKPLDNPVAHPAGGRG